MTAQNETLRNETAQTETGKTPSKRTTLYRNGSVYSPADPFATAVLVDGDTVAWVGSEQAADAHSAGIDDVVDLDGALLAPAFVDGHVHITETGLALEGIDLTEAATLQDVLDAVAAAAQRLPGGVLLGHGWDERRWPEQRPPTAAELDRAAPGREVYLSRVDVHSAVVSGELAARAGLADLPGWSHDGRIERDAHHAARAVTHELDPAQRARVQRRALRAAAAAGIACVTENAAPHVGSPADLRSALDVSAAEPLPEVLAYWGDLAEDAKYATAVLNQLRETLGEHAPSLLGLAGDLTADGSVGSRTAYFREPYADAAAAGLDAGHRGRAYLDAEQVREHVVACTQVGVQAGFHVIGDVAMDAVLAGFAAAADVVGIERLVAARHRLEHVEAVDADAIAELARLGLTASVQPAFDAAWGGHDGMYAERLGPARGARLNPFASMAAAGVPLAFGSDSPVTPFDPWGAVRAAVYHRTPGQELSARAAFLAHTRGAWRAARRDGEGVVAPGTPATFAVWAATDLVVQAADPAIAAWSTDPRSGTPVLPDVSPGAKLPECLRTVLRGRTIHDTGALAGARR
ncbi:MAG TPA: amidohydrolase family protein [Nocardioidaceae bacterium]|nr:amidohydrolase family protein [Nocardioidaceae bacterium]